MPGPWEKYQTSAPTADAGPWTKYGAAPPAPPPAIPDAGAQMRANALNKAGASMDEATGDVTRVPVVNNPYGGSVFMPAQTADTNPIIRGVHDIGQGVVEMSRPKLDDKFEAGHKILSGTMQVGSPLLGGALVAAPVATGAGLLLGGAAQSGVESGLEAVHAPPGLTHLAGDVAGLVAGHAGSKVAPDVARTAGVNVQKYGARIAENAPATASEVGAAVVKGAKAAAPDFKKGVVAAHVPFVGKPIAAIYAVKAAKKLYDAGVYGDLKSAVGDLLKPTGAEVRASNDARTPAWADATPPPDIAEEVAAEAPPQTPAAAAPAALPSGRTPGGIANQAPEPVPAPAPARPEPAWRQIPPDAAPTPAPAPVAEAPAALPSGRKPGGIANQSEAPLPPATTEKLKAAAADGSLAALPTDAKEALAEAVNAGDARTIDGIVTLGRKPTAGELAHMAATDNKVSVLSQFVAEHGIDITPFEEGSARIRQFIEDAQLPPTARGAAIRKAAEAAGRTDILADLEREQGFADTAYAYGVDKQLPVGKTGYKGVSGEVWGHVRARVDQAKPVSSGTPGPLETPAEAVATSENGRTLSDPTDSDPGDGEPGGARLVHQPDQPDRPHGASRPLSGGQQQAADLLAAKKEKLAQQLSELDRKLGAGDPAAQAYPLGAGAQAPTKGGAGRVNAKNAASIERMVDLAKQRVELSKQVDAIGRQEKALQQAAAEQPARAKVDAALTSWRGQLQPGAKVRVPWSESAEVVRVNQKSITVRGATGHTEAVKLADVMPLKAEDVKGFLEENPQSGAQKQADVEMAKAKAKTPTREIFIGSGVKKVPITKVADGTLLKALRVAQDLYARSNETTAGYTSSPQGILDKETILDYQKEAKRRGLKPPVELF